MRDFREARKFIRIHSIYIWRYIKQILVKIPIFGQKINHRPKFNANPITIQSDPRSKIVVIHVGKCAGDTIISALKFQLGRRYSIYEMHCFDADDRIQQCLQLKIANIYYLICTRDPIERFISAYNWQKHYNYSRGTIHGTKYAEYFEEFFPIDYFVKSLRSENPAVKIRAADFRDFGHMKMGQSWYTPLSILGMFPRSHTFLCDAGSIRQDLDKFFTSLKVPKPHDYILENNKAGYKSEYPSEGFFSTELSEEARNILRVEISEDYQVLNDLRERFAKM